MRKSQHDFSHFFPIFPSSHPLSPLSSFLSLHLCLLYLSFYPSLLSTFSLLSHYSLSLPIPPFALHLLSSTDPSFYLSFFSLSLLSPHLSPSIFLPLFSSSPFLSLFSHSWAAYVRSRSIYPEYLVLYVQLSPSGTAYLIRSVFVALPRCDRALAHVDRNMYILLFPIEVFWKVWKM